MNRNLNNVRQAIRPDGLFAAGAKSTVCALFAAALLLGGCGKDEPEPKHTLRIAPAMETVSFGASDDKSYTFTVITEQPAWKAVSDQEWCKVTMDTGAGTFTVTAEPNDGTTAPDPATITVTAGNAEPQTITATQEAARYDVYVIGYTDSHRMCYWINGELHTIEGLDYTKNMSLHSICIDDNSVYLGGSYNSQSCYWKDGKINYLEQPVKATYSECTAIALSGDRILCGGNSRQNNFNYFCHWSDHTLTRNFDGWSVLKSNCYDIAVDNGTVYFLGVLYDQTQSIMWYLKEGENYIVLEPLAGYAKAWSEAIAVSEGKVYVAGYCEDENEKAVAGYWVDGVFMPLEDPATVEGQSWANAIAVENGTVHITGMEYKNSTWRAFYWTEKQGITILPEPEWAVDLGQKQGMEICGGKVFISGNYSLDRVSRPCYWVDGERVDLSVPDGERGTCISLAVMKR